MNRIEQANRAMLEELTAGRAMYDQAAAAQAAVFTGEPVSPQPLLLHADPAKAAPFPAFNLKEIHFDPAKMLYNGLIAARSCLAGGREAVPSIRANMGCGIVPTLLGVKQNLYEDKMPWVTEHIPKGQLAEMRPEDIVITPEFRAALDQMAYLAEQVKGTGVRVYPLDIQGAFDTAHIAYGTEIFYDVYDDADFVHHLLDLSCAAISLAMQECLRRMPDSQAYVTHYNALAMPRSLGGIKLSEDTSTLLSQEHIAEFVVPYLHRTLAEIGGGYVHYCGHNEHLFQAVLDEPLAHGLNFGNPDHHDMHAVLAALAARGKLYYGGCPRPEGMALEAYFEALQRSALVDGRIWLLLQHTCTADDAALVSDAWNRATDRVLA